MSRQGSGTVRAVVVVAALLGWGCASTQVTHWTGMNVSSAVRDFGPPTRVAARDDRGVWVAVGANQSGQAIRRMDPFTLYSWDTTKKGPQGVRQGPLYLEHWDLLVGDDKRVQGWWASTQLAPGANLGLKAVLAELGRPTRTMTATACAANETPGHEDPAQADGTVYFWQSFWGRGDEAERWHPLLLTWVVYADRNNSVLGWKLVESNSSWLAASDPPPRLLCLPIPVIL